MLGRVIAALALAASVAHANARDDDDARPADDQLVLVNAAVKLGDIGQIANLRRVLSQRGLLFKLPEKLEATLDGRNVLISDLDAIKAAAASSDYATALKIIETDEGRILEQAANGDPIPALAQLAEWRGIIAAALDERDEALKEFRCAYRLNPAWIPDKRLVSPRVRAMIKKAHRETTETGTLRVDADPDEAKVQVDGGDARPAKDRQELPVGIHLVQITAPDREPYADLVEIDKDQTYRMPISLDKETKVDRAARLVDATAAAPAGKPRLKRARQLARLTGVKKMLVIEDGSEDHVTVRLYDVELRKVSNQIQLDGDTPSAAIARKIKVALDPDNLVDAGSVVNASSPRAQPAKWYEHWYVWAGVAAVGLAGYGGYSYATREPTMVRGF
ncbi:MAG: PEGA domain-containing protein [Acidobacteriota bacterium]